MPFTAVEELEAPFPWLVAGATGRWPDAQEPNFGLFTALPASPTMAAWERLMAQVGAAAAVHGRQVHGSRIRVHGEMGPGLHLVGPGDGHATRTPGLLLAVTTADCVPVSVVDPRHGAVSLLHAGWRGVAADVLEEGLAAMRTAFGTEPPDVHVHLGPAICGACYEVGPEVFEALGLPGGDRLDLRAALRDRSVRAGVEAERVSLSRDCTRCGPGSYFSHRGGDQARQIAFLMVRPEVPVADRGAAAR